MYSIEVEIKRIWVDGEEINFYGAVEDLCVIGEVVVRLGSGLVEELVRKVSSRSCSDPGCICTDYAAPDALEDARRNNVSVLKWSGDLTPIEVERL